MRISGLITLLLVSSFAFAHHGSNGQFDHEKTINVSGVVTKFRMVNPHSWLYFDVTDKDGNTKEWRCELRAGSLMKRTGWSADMFKPGTKVTIEGSAARREPEGCYTRNITFADGKTIARNEVLTTEAAVDTSTPVVQLAAGTPNINGNWVAPPRVRQAPAAGNAGGMGMAAVGGNEAMGMAAAQTANAGMAMAAGGRARGPQYNQSEAGIAASAGFERTDNPRLNCSATNIFHDWTFDQHVNTIEQSDDKIVMKYGFMDIVRTIHLDQKSHPENIEATRGGYSIGAWDGDILKVDTRGFLPGYLAATFNGVKHSDQLHVTEEFYISEDGDFLERKYTINDAKYLAGAYSGEDRIRRTTASFDPYACEDLTEEIVEGF